MSESIPTYIAYCCREWIAPYGFRGGRCGLCGERPVYLREDPLSPVQPRPPIDERKTDDRDGN